MFPLFVAERARRQAAGPVGQGSPEPAAEVSPRADKVLMGLSSVDHRLLRKRDLPFGSSIFLAAVKP